MKRCHRCGGEYRLETEPRAINFGRRRATVDADFYRCEECGDTFVTFEQADEARLRASRQIREEEGLLQPEEIAAVRKREGLSQEEFERLLGKGKKTVVRWESGAVFQSKTADELIRLIRDVPQALRFLAQRKGVRLRNETVSTFIPQEPRTAIYQNVSVVTPGSEEAPAFVSPSEHNVLGFRLRDLAPV